MQTGSSGTLIGLKSGQTTFVPLWDRMEGAWLRTQVKLPSSIFEPHGHNLSTTSVEPEFVAQ